MYQLYEKYLSTLHDSAQYRRLYNYSQAYPENFHDFSTNDYLGLSRNPNILTAMLEAGKQYGTGATGSRLLSGDLDLYEKFERQIAIDKKTQASLIFNSGFQANISTLASLLDHKVLKAKPIVYFDRLNHASLYQAVFLSKAELYRYRHNDINHLSALLQESASDNRPKFIISETLFGMDGDIAPLEQLAELARKYNAFLYLDEAHATGVFGEQGYGLSTNFDLSNVPHLVMGTFSKALGCSGGYVATNNIIKEFLINKASGFIYSTAPSPAMIGGAYYAWRLLKSLNDERDKLKELSRYLRERLQMLGLDTGNSTTHIIPIILKEEHLCLKVKDALLKDGMIVSRIRPPTVPANSSRLRIALTANHTKGDVEKLLYSLKKALA